MYKAGIIEFSKSGIVKNLLVETTSKTYAIATAKETCCFKKVDTYFEDENKIVLYNYEILKKKYDLINEKIEKQKRKVYEKRAEIKSR